MKDTTVTALFRATDPREEWTQWGGAAYFVAWTTTPWTLPSNTALCVGPNIDYVAVETYNPYNAEKITIILAESRLNAYLAPEGNITDGGGMPDYNKGREVLCLIASWDATKEPGTGGAAL